MELFDNLNKFKNNIALIDEKKNILTFGDLEEISIKQKKIIKKRSLILFITNNNIYSISSYISSTKNKFVSMFLDIKTKKKEIKNIINIYKPHFIICPKNFLNNIKVKIIEKSKYSNYCLFKTNFKNKVNFNKNLCLLLPTSGSLGSPKFVRLSYKNLEINSKDIVKYLNISSNDRSITNMTMTYSYMISIINTHISSGGSIFVTNESIMQKKFWKFYKEGKITCFNGVPYMYQILIKYGLNNINTKYLKYLTQAGGKLDEKYIKIINNYFKRFKKNFFIMYGQTEASPRISYLEPKFLEKKCGSVGKGLKNTKIWIENDNKKKIFKAFGIGEIVIKGKNVSMGYSENLKDLKKSYQNSGILRTGDLGYYDNDGFLFIKGRSKRIAKIYGYRLNLDEIEKKLSEAGYENICIAEKNKIIIFSENRSYLPSKVIDLASKITSINKIAFSYKLIRSIPKTSSGKIEYKNLKGN